MQAASEEGDVWVMLKHNENKAFWERISKIKFNKMIASGQCFQVLAV